MKGLPIFLTSNHIVMAQQEYERMNGISSGSYKNNADGTRNNRVTMMFVTLIPVRMLSESWNGLVLNSENLILRATISFPG